MNSTEPPEGPTIPPYSTQHGLFSHSGGLSSHLFNTAIVLAIVAISIVALRAWISKRIINKWHTDDTLIIVATIFATLGSISAAISARLGGGVHIQYCSLRGVVVLLENAKWGGIPTYNLATVFTKASVLTFYLRFSVDIYFIICTYVVLCIVAVNGVFHTVAALAFHCTTNGAPICQDLINIYTASAIINCATDVIILLLPFWILHPMKVPMSRKIGIALILMAGGFVLVVSIIRLAANLKTDEQLDLTYDLGWGILWSILEPWAGIICACLPCMRPVVTRWLPTQRAKLWFPRSWFSGSGRTLKVSSAPVSLEPV